jgi:hypothetical protein
MKMRRTLIRFKLKSSLRRSKSSCSRTTISLSAARNHRLNAGVARTDFRKMRRPVRVGLCSRIFLILLAVLDLALSKVPYSKKVDIPRIEQFSEKIRNMRVPCLQLLIQPMPNSGPVEFYHQGCEPPNLAILTKIGACYFPERSEIGGCQSRTTNMVIDTYFHWGI